MKTKQMHIAISFFITFGITLPLHAQNTGFGIGLTHNDTSEIIAYITHDSPLQDADVAVGDEIVAINGASIRGRDIVLTGMLNADTITFRIHRHNDTIFSDVHATRSRLHKCIQSCGMLDKTTAIVRPLAFNADSVEALEALLDSLATGESGYGKNTDEIESRMDEARAYTLRQYGNRFPTYSPFDLDNTVAAFRNDFNNYITGKYGWSMNTLMLDMRGDCSGCPKEVLRSIRIFCKEHHISLMREV